MIDTRLGRGFGLVLLAAAAGPALFDPANAAAMDRPAEVVRLDPGEAARLGWQAEGLDRVFAYADSLGTDALVIATAGRTVGAMGDLAEPRAVHSVRKAFLSAVVGQHVAPGPRQIPLHATLEQLGIDDAPIPLTPLQRQATVLHLLRSMSGINHPAAADGGLTADTDRRLGHGENKPGTVWAYNNWDYNALTTIFETGTGLTVGEAFRTALAEPLGMQDFTPDAASYEADPARSRHKAAMFRMSARDLVRFGELYLGGGVYQGRRLLPEGWVDRITADFAETGREGLRSGHGYLWWIPDRSTGLPAGSFWAMGIGSQAVFVIPAWQTVVVHQADTHEFWRRLQRSIRQDGLAPDAAFERLALSCLKPSARDDEYCREDRFILRREFSRLVSLIAGARR